MDWYGYELDERGWILRPGDDPAAENAVIEAMPTSDRLAVRVVRYGPRGGIYTLHGGTLDDLRLQRLLLGEAITFGEEVEEKRQQWLRDRDEVYTGEDDDPRRQSR